MYSLIKSKLASKSELEEWYTLDEALKLYALYKMDIDVRNGSMEESKMKANSKKMNPFVN